MGKARRTWRETLLGAGPRAYCMSKKEAWSGQASHSWARVFVFMDFTVKALIPLASVGTTPGLSCSSRVLHASAHHSWDISAGSVGFELSFTWRAKRDPR